MLTAEERTAFIEWHQEEVEPLFVKVEEYINKIKSLVEQIAQIEDTNVQNDHNPRPSGCGFFVSWSYVIFFVQIYD